jgi:rhodanese-related sulfurtransferase
MERQGFLVWEEPIPQSQINPCKIEMKLLKGYGSVLALIAVATTAMVLYYTYASPLWISAEEAKKAIADRKFPIVLDVRTDLEYNLGHYPEAVHIPTATLNDDVEARLPNKEIPVLVYCNTGQRSRNAADLLKAKGYKTVRYISGPYWSLLR